MLKVLDAEQVRSALPWDALIGAIERAFRDGGVRPERHHHDLTDGVGPGTLLIMPGWQDQLGLGVKMVTVYPGNRKNGLPAISGLYVLFDPDNGTPTAVLDGGELTARRTAAASAMAARQMARSDATTLTIVGTGRLSPNLIQAHSQVRDIRKILIWGRDPAKARSVKESLHDRRASVTTDLEKAVRESDVVSCATLSEAPLILGEWLRPGVHLDLVGAFKPHMRETDAAVWRRADRIVVDTREGACLEAGDILRAEAEGVSVFDDRYGTLTELVQGKIRGRQTDNEITIFKSVGAAQEDLAAACLAISLSTQSTLEHQ